MGTYAYRMMLDTLQSNVGEIGIYEFAFKISTAWDGEAYNQQCYARRIAPRVRAWDRRPSIPKFVIFNSASFLKTIGAPVPVFESVGVYHEDSSELVKVGELRKIGKNYCFHKID